MKPKKRNTPARRRGGGLTGAGKRMPRRNPTGSDARLIRANQNRNLILIENWVITANIGKKLGNRRNMSPPVRGAWIETAKLTRQRRRSSSSPPARERKAENSLRYLVADQPHKGGHVQGRSSHALRPWTCKRRKGQKLKLTLTPPTRNELSRSAGEADPCKPNPFISSFASPVRGKI
jgi:hypothetical protein